MTFRSSSLLCAGPKQRSCLRSLHFCQTTNQQLIVSLLSKNVGKKHGNPDMHARMHASRWLHKQGTQHATGTKDVVKICFKFSDPLEAKEWWETCGFGEKNPAQIKTEIWQQLSAVRPVQHTAGQRWMERFYARLSDTIGKTFFFSHYQRCLHVWDRDEWLHCV